MIKERAKGLGVSSVLTHTNRRTHINTMRILSYTESAAKISA